MAPADQKQSKRLSTKTILLIALALGLVLIGGYLALRHYQNNGLNRFQAQPLNHVKPLVRPKVKLQALITPTEVKNSYSLTGAGTGSGTIAIVDAYDDPTVENDLGVFSSQFGLPSCTASNGCFEKHKMQARLKKSGDWAVEEALDTQWAHAVAPGAKILLVEANSSSGNDLLSAINYARNRTDVVAVSLSWGGNEFSSEANYESYFTSKYGATFFAASGDNGHGTSWPAVSANVVGVGGTTLNVDSSGNFLSEVAWSGSGGGVSSYINQPSYQSTYGITGNNGKRATPDVSYNADPNTGYPVYDSTSYYGFTGWFQVGGTSAGAPQWAALRTIAKSLTLPQLYQDAKSTGFFRDITAGSNGSCITFCAAGPAYDYVTGLGSPTSTSY